MSDIHINRAGQNQGIFSQTEVQAGLDTGRFLGTDLAWRTGMENWKPLSQWADFTVPTAPLVPAIPIFAGGTVLPGDGGDLPSWEQKAQIGLLNGFAATVKEVLTEPAATFSRMKATGGFTTPFLYMLISVGVATALAMAVQLGLQGLLGSAMTQNAEINRLLVAQGIGIGAGIVGFLIVLPIALFVFSFIGAGLWHLALMVLGGANKPFEATYRVYCYATGSTSLVGLVPCCGGLAAAIWKIVVGAIGLSKVHGITTGKAVLAILLPLILCCGLCVAGLIPLYHSLLSNPEFARALKDFH